MPSFLYSQFFITPAYPTTSFAGQTVIITGSNVGLGLEAARHVVRLGAAKAILAVRNRTAGEEAKQSIEKSTQTSGVCEVWDLDLASYKSVIAFAERVSTLERLDVVLENASIATGTYRVAEGHEQSVTVNLISTILLALLVLPKLRESAKKFPGLKPRWTVVVSEVHGWTKFPEWKTENTFAALDVKDSPTMKERYPTSKLLQVLVLREIVGRMTDDSVIVNMVNPGLCHSQLGREAGWTFVLMKLVLARRTEVGSRTLVAGAAGGEESHGAYMSDGVVHNDMLSPFVCSDEGKQAQEKIWGELVDILEEIKPGVTNNL